MSGKAYWNPVGWGPRSKPIVLRARRLVMMYQYVYNSFQFDNGDPAAKEMSAEYSDQDEDEDSTGSSSSLALESLSDSATESSDGDADVLRLIVFALTAVGGSEVTSN